MIVPLFPVLNLQCWVHIEITSNVRNDPSFSVQSFCPGEISYDLAFVFTDEKLFFSYIATVLEKHASNMN